MTGNVAPNVQVTHGMCTDACWYHKGCLTLNCVLITGKRSLSSLALNGKKEFQEMKIFDPKNWPLAN